MAQVNPAMARETRLAQLLRGPKEMRRPVGYWALPLLGCSIVSQGQEFKLTAAWPRVGPSCRRAIPSDLDVYKWQDLFAIIIV